MKHADEETWSVEMATPREREIMALRCESQDHEPENCCSAAFQIYERCRWCGEVV